MKEAFIFDIIRTPLGYGDHTGSLYEVHPVDLLSTCLRNLAQRSNFYPGEVGEIVVGCTTPIRDQGANIARAAVFQAAWPPTVSGLQINKFESSGLEALRICQLKITGGETSLFIGGGLESMSRIALGADQGALQLHPEFLNRNYLLPARLQADLLATSENYTVEELEEYAATARHLATQANSAGRFTSITVPINDQNGLTVLHHDEVAASPGPYLPGGNPVDDHNYDAIALQTTMAVEKIQHLHHSGTSAAPADGAALALLGSAEAGNAYQLSPRAKILSYGYCASAPTPGWSSILSAVERALSHARLTKGDIDLWESYDPFAAYGYYFRRSLELGPECHNVNGGALGLGTSPGAIGAIMLANLLNELENRNQNLGLVAIPSMSGMATALVIERSAATT